MNILKQKIMITALLLFMAAYAYGQEFKVNGAKYMGNDDGTAVLIEYKKAAGKLEIPSTVTGKKGKIYTVTAIGYSVFAYSQLTEVVIPNTVKELGLLAFYGSTSLEKVTLSTEIKHIPTDAFYGCRSLSECSLEHVETIGEGAFARTNFKSLVIPASVKKIGVGAFSWNNFESLVIPANVKEIGKDAFKNTKLSSVTILPDTTALVVSDHAFDGAPIKTLFIDREVLPPSNVKLGQYQKYPFDYNKTLKELTIGEHVMSLPNTLVLGCSALEKIIVMGKKLKADNLGKIIFSVEREQLRNHLSVEIQGETEMFTPQKALRYFNEREAFEAYKKYMARDFINTATWFPENIDNVYASMDVRQIEKHPYVYIAAINYVCDSVYLPKTEFSAAESHVLARLCNSQLQVIGLDNGLGANMIIPQWASHDLLNKDSKAEQHKEVYERILALSETLIRSKTKGDQGGFDMMQQLIALCGLGRWKDAERYFPKVHRAITENGKYLVPDEVYYIQSELTKRGYNPITPKYGAGSEKSDTEEMVEFFFKRGLELYKDHKDRQRIKEEEEAYRQFLLEQKAKKKK